MNTKLSRILPLSVLSILLLIVLCAPVTAFAQTTKPTKPAKRGSVEYLKQVNGFNGIQLGDDVTSILNSKLSFLDGDSRKDADGCYKYEYTDSNALKLPGKDGEADLVAIRTYKNKIVNIYVFFARQDGYKLLSDFLGNYGPCTNRPSELKDIYSWNSSAVDLSLKYQADAALGIAVFTSKKMEIEMADDRQKALMAVQQQKATIAAEQQQSEDAEAIMKAASL